MAAQTIGLFFAAAGTAISGVGLVLIAIQASRGARSGKATFAFDLELAFQEQLTASYIRFLPDGDWSPEGPGPQSLPETIEFERYFDYFALLNVLRRSKLLEMELIDRLFAYRFFIAMHSPHTLAMLARLGGYWPDLDELYDVWSNFRSSRGSPVPRPEYTFVFRTRAGVRKADQ